MNHQQLDAWVRRYIQVWLTNDPREIGQLFSDNARYYTEPYAKAWQGRETIVKEWLDRKDESDDFSFRYEILAVTEIVGFVRGWTQYHNPPRAYSNLWVIKLDTEECCSEFTEWWMQHPES